MSSLRGHGSLPAMGPGKRPRRRRVGRHVRGRASRAQASKPRPHHRLSASFQFVDGLIRDARSDEFATAGELTALAYAPILAFGSEDPYLAELRDAASRATDAQLLVYVSPSDDVLGTVTVARPGTAYAEISRVDELEVRMLAVSPQARGRGIGGRLMSRVHDLARAEGFTSIALSVIATNTGALRFYDGLGYQPDGSRDWFPVPNMPAPLKVLVKDLSQKD